MRGGYLLTLPLYILSIFFGWYTYIYRKNPPQFIDFWEIVLMSFAILTGINLLMRYALIHGDKIKTPIKVTVTPENVYWEKGRAKYEFYLTGIRDVKIEIDDKKAMIDVNYRASRDKSRMETAVQKER